jgi:hypothetical protein
MSTMKYRAEIEIEKPIEELKNSYSKDILKWHKDIIKHELIEGERGKINAKYHVITEQNGQFIENVIKIVKVINDNEWWIEIDKENDFKMLKKLSFHVIGPNKTKVVEDYELELISFKNNINKALNSFKEFSENKN